MANRAELEQALADGCTVQVAGHVHAIKYPDPLPPDSVPGQPYTGVITRDKDGNVTRHGMELAIAQGGSVMHQGRPVDDVTKLPTAADLARFDERRAEAERKRLLDQRAQIDGELSKLSASAANGSSSGTSKSDEGELERLRRELAEAKAKATDAGELERLRKELADLKARPASGTETARIPPPPLAAKRDEDEDRVGPRRK